MPLLALLVTFIVVPIAELYVILTVADSIGVPLTLLLLAAASVAGSLLLKSQGRAAWRRFIETTAAGRVPHREVLDGALVIFGGAFLITPGFLTDTVGLMLLLPPTRVLARRLLVRALGDRLAIGVAGAARRRRSGHFDVDGTATETSDDPFESPRRLPR